jgi:hypothetical protein
MYRYSRFSLIIDSELELAELSEGHGRPDVVIRLGTIDWPGDSATIQDEVVPFEGIGRFHVKGGREIVVDPLPDADRHTLRLLLMGKLMACLLRQRGCLPLHASGVAIGGQGALFLGESGSGKSTTAAAFYARGYGVLADDICAVRAVECGVEVEAAWPGLRLLDDARQVIGHCAEPSGFRDDKHVFNLERKEPTSAFLVKRIYWLDYHPPDHIPQVRIEVISGCSTVALLNSHSFLRTWNAGNELRQINLDRSASIASLVRVQRLVRPRSLGYLPELVDFVEKDIAACD